MSVGAPASGGVVGRGLNIPCAASTVAARTGTSPIAGTSHHHCQRRPAALRADRTACGFRGCGGLYGPGTRSLLKTYFAEDVPFLAYRTPGMVR